MRVRRLVHSHPWRAPAPRVSSGFLSTHPAAGALAVLLSTSRGRTETLSAEVTSLYRRGSRNSLPRYLHGFLLPALGSFLKRQLIREAFPGQCNDQSTCRALCPPLGPFSLFFHVTFFMNKCLFPTKVEVQESRDSVLGYCHISAPSGGPNNYWVLNEYWENEFMIQCPLLYSSLYSRLTLQINERRFLVPEHSPLEVRICGSEEGETDASQHSFCVGLGEWSVLKPQTFVYRAFLKPEK